MFKTLLYVVLFGIAIYYFSEYMEGCSYDTDMRLDGKTVIVTGANTGIGKETVIDLVQRGAKVYMGCRSTDRGQNALNDILEQTGVDKANLDVLKLDLSSLASVREFVQEYRNRETRLDILVNNAGIMFVPFSKTVDGYELTFATNHLGHFLLTTLLADLLVTSAPSRVVTVSSLGNTFSSGMKFDDLMMEKDYSMIQSYIQSKLANILFARELAKRLGGKGVTSVSLHPGAISTELDRYLPVFKNIPYAWEIFHVVASPFYKNVWHGARTSIYCALAPEVTSQNGAYFSDCATRQAHSEGESDESAERLWSASIELAKLQKTETLPELAK